MSTTAATGIKRLDRKVWATKIRDYIIARQTRKEADAAARAAESTIKATRAALREAMGSAQTAICGEAVLTCKSTAGADAALTLKNGDKIKWSTVTSVLIGNRTIPADDIASLYGGRAGSEDIDVSGSP